ncbi:hypothetical protein IGB42_03807 [Andreprevotia sp. IGB-42]|nr:hypothetical protein IGB42_03807 [Andreprevotia sp. IGB-42]
MLTVQVRAHFQCDLNVRAVFEAPTIAAFASKLGIKDDEVPASPAPSERNWVLVEDNLARLDSPHVAAHDIVLVPGAGGSAEVFNGIALSLPAGQANVFVLHHDGIDNEADPLGCFVAMAEKYAPQVLRHSTGRILLAGYCVGGLIAFEMAQVLQRLGVAESRLCFIDTAMVPADYTFQPFDEAYFKGEFFKAICDTYSRVGDAVSSHTFDGMPLEECVAFAVRRMDLHDPTEHAIWHAILRQRYLAEKYHALATRKYWIDHHADGRKFGEPAGGGREPFMARIIESDEIGCMNSWANSCFVGSVVDQFEGKHLAILKNHESDIANALFEFINTPEINAMTETAEYDS